MLRCSATYTVLPVELGCFAAVVLSPREKGGLGAGHALLVAGSMFRSSSECVYVPPVTGAMKHIKYFVACLRYLSVGVVGL